MADFTWTGSAGDGNHDTAGNWLGGAAPSGAGPHNITFDRGNYSMTSNIAGVSYSIGTLTITQGFGGNIGSTSAAYSATGNIAALLCAGQGQYYKIGASGNVGTSLANRVQIQIQAGTQFVATSGTWQYFFQQGGSLLIEASAVFTTQCMLVGVQGLAQTNGTAITLLEIDSASDFTTYRSMTTANANASSVLRTMGSAAITTGTFTGATLNFQNNSAATHTTVTLKAGARLSLTGVAANQTVTNLYQWSGTSYDRTAGGASLTVTNYYPIYFGSGGGINDQPA